MNSILTRYHLLECNVFDSKILDKFKLCREIFNDEDDEIER